MFFLLLMKPHWFPAEYNSPNIYFRIKKPQYMNFRIISSFSLKIQNKYYSYASLFIIFRDNFITAAVSNQLQYQEIHRTKFCRDLPVFVFSSKKYCTPFSHTKLRGHLDYFQANFCLLWEGRGFLMNFKYPIRVYHC